MARIIFLAILTFDSQGVLDFCLDGVIAKAIVRNEAVKFGFFYPWEVDGKTSIYSCRTAYDKLRHSKNAPPDEVCRYCFDNRVDNCFYAAMRFNYECQQSFMRRMSQAESDYDMLEEFQRRHKIYDLLDDINRPQIPLWQKRIKCHDLRYYLGDKDYEMGTIPSCVPLGAFTMID